MKFPLLLHNFNVFLITLRVKVESKIVLFIYKNLGPLQNQTTTCFDQSFDGFQKWKITVYKDLAQCKKLKLITPMIVDILFLQFLRGRPISYSQI